MTRPAQAIVAGQRASGLVEVTDDPSVLDGGGRWAVVVDFEGRMTAARFAEWEAVGGSSSAPLQAGGAPSSSGSAVAADALSSSPAAGVLSSAVPPPVEAHGSPSGSAAPNGHPAEAPAAWPPVPADAWASSLDRHEYRAGVVDIRERIAAGDVYQVNLCRVLRAPLEEGVTLHGLHQRLAARHPAHYAAHVFLPEHDLDVACASPELFLRRDGEHLVSQPIKGTAPTVEELLPKDRAENVMIVDLVRNDLGRVCRPGTVRATAICAPETFPGLVHLVSTVEGDLRPDVGWTELLEATFPAGSIVGAPKLAALDVIAELEPVPRGPYCGAIGWIDADAGTAELAVGIRTFWREGQTLRFGTGGGITWDSDPDGEWRETELKARRLLGVAAAG